MNLNKVLCTGCRKKIKALKASEKAVRKLKSNPSADWKRKQALKAVIAEGMRMCPTDGETYMEDVLLSEGFQFSKQQQIGPYIADFLVLPELVIEIDGETHFTRKEYDAARDEYMNQRGFHVLRFTNKELYDSIDGQHLVDRICQFVELPR